MATIKNNTLDFHVKAVIKGQRHFENVFQSITRMILGKPDNISKVNVNGKTTYDFKVFRQGKRHLVGMYDEINSFVSFVKDASEGGSSKEMAFVLIGEPGNGKTFFVEYLNKIYRNFIASDNNMRYTFRLKNLDQLGGYGKILYAESQSYESFRQS
jgi:serine protein kinase